MEQYQCCYDNMDKRQTDYVLSRPDLRELCMSLFWFGQGVIWGWVFYVIFFYVFVFLCFWPGMVLNQGQLTIVVSDWEPYFFPPVFCG